MGIYTSNYKQILREYEKKRDATNKLLKSKQEQIYSKIPRIKEIDKELSLTGIKMSKLILENPSNSVEFINLLEQSNSKLMEEKNMLLKQNGYTDKFLELTHDCHICKDTGYVESKHCKCLKQKLIQLAYEQSNLKSILNLENFDNFDFRYYSEEIDSNEKISPKNNVEKIFQTCFHFCQNFDYDFKNLLLYGTTGLGKTFLCNCIAKELLDKGKTILYLTAFQLFKQLEDLRFKDDKDNNEKDIFLDTILSVDLLIIDDLGTEFSNSLTGSELFNCLNTRLLNKKSTIISTNLKPNDIQNQYSLRIVSRIFGSYSILKFFGTDIRITKKYQNTNE